jgi:hypothetical protein
LYTLVSAIRAPVFLKKEQVQKSATAQKDEIIPPAYTLAGSVEYNPNLIGENTAGTGSPKEQHGDNLSDSNSDNTIEDNREPLNGPTESDKGDALGSNKVVDTEIVSCSPLRDPNDLYMYIHNHHELLTGDPRSWGTADKFTRAQLPLWDELGAAFLALFAAEKTIIASRQEGVDPIICNAAEANQPIHRAYSIAFMNIMNGIELLNKNKIPLLRNDIIAAYNKELSRVIHVENELLIECGYDAIDVNEVLIKHSGSGEVSRPFSLASAQSISENDFFQNINEATEFYSKFRKENMFLSGSNFVDIVNRYAKNEKGFNIFLGGFGFASTTFSANLDGYGTRFLRQVNTDDESIIFCSTQFGVSFEKTTRDNPNWIGRAKIYSWMGKKMAEIFNYPNGETLTFDVDLIKSPTNGDVQFYSMTSAGDMTLADCGETRPENLDEMIVSSIGVQIINWIVGNLDGHNANSMITLENGKIRGIDPGLILPPWDIGETIEEIKSNYNSAYVKHTGLQAFDDDWLSEIVPNTSKRIVIKLPPLKPDVAERLREFTSAEGRREFIGQLRANNLTEAEISATEKRLDIVSKQLDDVEIINEGEKYSVIWNRKDSRLNGNNCWLLRSPS